MVVTASWALAVNVSSVVVTVSQVVAITASWAMVATLSGAAAVQ